MQLLPLDFMKISIPEDRVRVLAGLADVFLLNDSHFLSEIERFAAQQSLSAITISNLDMFISEEYCGDMNLLFLMTNINSCKDFLAIPELQDGNEPRELGLLTLLVILGSLHCSFNVDHVHDEAGNDGRSHDSYTFAINPSSADKNDGKQINIPGSIVSQAQRKLDRLKDKKDKSDQEDVGKNLASSKQDLLEKKHKQISSNKKKRDY